MAANPYLQSSFPLKETADSPSTEANFNGICRLCLSQPAPTSTSIAKQPSYDYNFKMLPSGKRLMTRMDRFQKKVLEQEFERDNNWS